MSDRREQPDFRPRLTFFQLMLEGMALAGLGLLLLLTAFAFNVFQPLPFLAGWLTYLQEDTLQVLLVLSGLAVLLYVLFSVMGRFPRYLNYPGHLSAPQISIHYQFLRSLLRWLKLQFMLCLLFLAYTALLLGNGTLEQFNLSNLFFFLLLIIVTIGMYRYRIRMHLKQGAITKPHDTGNH